MKNLTILMNTMSNQKGDGLFAVGQFKTDNTFIIDSSLTDILADKEENVYIWCHANKFVEKFDLKGFYTGMFVSEIIEALYCQLQLVEQDVVDESNDGFSRIVSKYINNSKSSIYIKTIFQFNTSFNTICSCSFVRCFYQSIFSISAS